MTRTKRKKSIAAYSLLFPALSFILNHFSLSTQTKKLHWCFSRVNSPRRQLTQRKQFSELVCNSVIPRGGPSSWKKYFELFPPRLLFLLPQTRISNTYAQAPFFSLYFPGWFKRIRLPKNGYLLLRNFLLVCRKFQLIFSFLKEKQRRNKNENKLQILFWRTFIFPLYDLSFSFLKLSFSFLKQQKRIFTKSIPEEISMRAF